MSVLLAAASRKLPILFQFYSVAHAEAPAETRRSLLPTGTQVPEILLAGCFNSREDAEADQNQSVYHNPMRRHVH
jgi:hypothetical protein